jgi:oleandomycin transport system ATP-binding protein
VVTVQVNGDTALNETVRRLDAAGIAVTELALRLPSLDEVFFALTGRHAGKDDNSDKEPPA